MLSYVNFSKLWAFFAVLLNLDKYIRFWSNRLPAQVRSKRTHGRLQTAAKFGAREAEGFKSRQGRQQSGSDAGWWVAVVTQTSPIHSTPAEFHTRWTRYVFLQIHVCRCRRRRQILRSTNHRSTEPLPLTSQMMSHVTATRRRKPTDRLRLRWSLARSDAETDGTIKNVTVSRSSRFSINLTVFSLSDITHMYSFVVLFWNFVQRCAEEL